MIVPEASLLVIEPTHDSSDEPFCAPLYLKCEPTTVIGASISKVPGGTSISLFSAKFEVTAFQTMLLSEAGAVGACSPQPPASSWSPGRHRRLPASPPGPSARRPD